MNSVMIAMLVFVGVLAGVLAGYVMKRGGYGMRWDIIRSRRQRRGKLDLLGLEDLARSRADRAGGSRLYRGGHADRRSTHVATPTLDMEFLVEAMKAKGGVLFFAASLWMGGGLGACWRQRIERKR